MHWDTAVAPANLPDFETQARIKRYRLLARASLEAGIRELLTGHHQDDQVETILLRLIQLRNPPLSALRGMSVASRIPCCTGIHGAETGGGVDDLEIKPSILGHLLSQSRSRQATAVSPQHLPPINSRLSKIPFASRTDNILIHRPLLGFQKDRLIYTCLANGIDYVNDPTNFDPTMTLRNTIRHLRTNHRLPRALEAASILRLRASADTKHASVTQRARALMPRFRILEFTPQSGVMLLQLPPDLAQMVATEADAVISCLSNILQAVSPICDENTGTVPHELVESLLAHHRRRDGESSSSFRTTALNINRVMMECAVATFPDGSRDQIWRLSRQPMRARELDRSSVAFQRQGQQHWSPWVLWDGRFWIRIHCGDGQSIDKFTVRALRPEDLRNIRSRFTATPQQRSEVERLLTALTPGKIRWTLPVIVSRAGEIVALPTLWDDVITPTTAGGREVNHSARSATVKWEIQYKAMPELLRNSELFSQRFHTHRETERVGGSPPLNRFGVLERRGILVTPKNS